MRLKRSRSSVRLRALWLIALVPLLLHSGCSGRAPTPPGFAQFRDTAYREPGTGLYIVDGDTPIRGDAALEEFYTQYLKERAAGSSGRGVRQHGLIVRTAGGADAVWSDTQKLDLTYCISTAFGANHDTVVKAMAGATADAWELAAKVRFNYASAQDSACTATNNSVIFDVNPAPAGAPYLARAFFPNSARADRNIFIAPDAFNAPPYSLTGILRHEVGHALGFRHEHTRPEAGICFEDNNWRALTPYDAASVMHYPQCKGTNTGDLVLTQKDKDGAAILYGPPGPAGTLQGTVTAAGAPLANATIQLTGPQSRSFTTNAAGAYGGLVLVGTYQLAAGKFGYVSKTIAGVDITDGATTTQDVALEQAPSHKLSGQVLDGNGNPLALISVSVLGTPLAPAVTDSTGHYQFDSLPDGDYQVQASGLGCFQSQTKPLTLAADQTLSFELGARSDSFGYSCGLTAASFIEAGTVLPVVGEGSAPVTLPFPFPLYGQVYERAYVSSKGFVSFLQQSSNYFNTPLPSTAQPNAAIYAFWTDLVVDTAASVRTEVQGTAPNRTFVIEWRNVRFYSSPLRVRFEMILSEKGEIVMQYADTGADPLQRGAVSTVGIEDERGAVGLQYAHRQPLLRSDVAIRYQQPAAGFLAGRVVDGVGYEGVAGATVRVLKGADTVRAGTTAADGSFTLHVPVGAYTISATAPRYSTDSGAVTVIQDQRQRRDLILQSARAWLSASQIEVIAAPGQERAASLTLANIGSQPLTWQLRLESYPAAPWLTLPPVTSGTLPSAASASLPLLVRAGLVPGSYTATLTLQSNSGPSPAIPVPVRLVVSGYRVAVNAGGAAYRDASGELWAADQPYTSGGWGYLQDQGTEATDHPIAGTAEAALYQDVRMDPYGYVFDGVPAGRYQVELRLAELAPDRPAGTRRFDVVIEGRTVLPAHDITAARGNLAADDRSFFVDVTDGSLDIRLVARDGDAPPIVNALRVTQRPDR